MLLTKVQKNIRNCLTYGQYGKHEDQAMLSTLATVSAFTILVRQHLPHAYLKHMEQIHFIFNTHEASHPIINFSRLTSFTGKGLNK